MPQRLAPLALASVQQLRQTLRRLTVLQAPSATFAIPPERRRSPRPPSLPTERTEWAETCADVRRIRA